MPSLALVIFLVQLSIHIINSIGSATFNELLWLLYNKIPISSSSTNSNIDTQRRELMRLRKQMNSTSPQDDFARWAKLRRQHDKLNADYEAKAATLKSNRSRFDMAATASRWLATNGIRFILQFWYSSTPIYWIPGGWMPYYIEWILSFPKAPLGSISVQSWWIACASVILLVGDAIVAVYALVRKWGVDQSRGMKEKPEGRKRPMAMGGREENKEL